MSATPMFVGQLPHWKYRLSPFLEIDGPCSMKLVFTTGPRLTGADQSENRGGSSASCWEAIRLDAAALGGVPVGSSRQPRRASAMSSMACIGGVLIEPSLYRV